MASTCGPREALLYAERFLIAWERWELKTSPNNLAAQPASWPAPRHGWYVTIVLLIGFTFSFIDRQVLNLLVEPIRADLDITDTQISFLQGLAFVLTYVAMSVPIGRMVDRFNRIAIMVGGVLVWSITTVACGLSQNYLQLMAARLGVGAGEAALSPAAWSVLADYFHPDKLARPISVYLMGPPSPAIIGRLLAADCNYFTDGHRLGLHQRHGHHRHEALSLLHPWRCASDTPYPR